MTHDIDENTLNYNLRYCIDEYVRLEEHREMLREKWFEGKTFEEIAEAHHIGVTQVKKVVYDTGDKIILRAAQMTDQRHSSAHYYLSMFFSLLTPLLVPRKNPGMKPKVG